MAAEKPTGFDDLPAEIRNIIYELSGCLKLRPLFVPMFTNVFGRGGPRPSPPQILSQPALTKTCKQVREETLPMFYGAARLHFRADPCFGARTEKLYAWLKNVGPTNAGMIMKVAVEVVAVEKTGLPHAAYIQSATPLIKLGVKREAIVFECPRGRPLVVDWSEE